MSKSEGSMNKAIISSFRAKTKKVVEIIMMKETNLMTLKYSLAELTLFLPMSYPTSVLDAY